MKPNKIIRGSGKQLTKSKIQEELKDDVIKNMRKPVRVGNFYSNSYVECESKDDRDKSLSVEEYIKGTIMQIWKSSYIF